jgi:hypothetical protein
MPHIPIQNSKAPATTGYFSFLGSKNSINILAAVRRVAAQPDGKKWVIEVDAALHNHHQNTSS